MKKWKRHKITEPVLMLVTNDRTKKNLELEKVRVMYPKVQVQREWENTGKKVQ